MDIYAEEIISHYENPHNKGRIEEPSVQFHETNPLCGDDITIYLKIVDGKISEVKFGGEGCAISMAAASMLTDRVIGARTEEVEGLDVGFVVKMMGIDPGPARLKCATLSLKALKGAAFLHGHRGAAGGGVG